MKLENTQISQLGRARRVVVAKDTTTIINGGGNADAIKGRINQIKDALQATRAALEEGIVPGGGIALLRAENAIRLDGHDRRDCRPRRRGIIDPAMIARSRRRIPVAVAVAGPT